MLHDRQFDTKFPDDAIDFDIAKWRLGTFIGKVIDSAFSISSPTYSTILKLDDELRSLVRESPKTLRSGALPETAFLVKPQFVPQMPPTTSTSNASFIDRARQFTMDQVSIVVGVFRTTTQLTLLDLSRRCFRRFFVRHTLCSTVPLQY